MSKTNNTATVTTQEELDAALASNAEVVEIRSPRGVWLEVSDSGSASVRASDSASVSAFDSASVSASDSASVSASGSASVRASGSASVRASGSASVRASGSASVRASDSASVSASKYVAVHLHSQRVTLDGDGHIIDLTGIDFNDAAQWCEYHAVEVRDGIAYLYKAVGDDWLSDYGTSYAPGTTPEAPDWKSTRQCGQGLHFCAHPHQSLAYKQNATKFVKCGVRIDEIVTLDDKIKAKRVVDPCVEVDVHGDVVDTSKGGKS
jgi:hypothetical protein